ncbi:protein of unknown function [Dialister histaminiformans]|uniref:DUF4357 domain-containing protein n=1 Tax=Allisonella histaminiformans TaxID=209880 RepID=A0A1G5WK10_9FIRM|nr:DUF4357 domain-containing protein [Allisonella histaminiformans]SDA58342.1 protein of unknown function [Allisonella histaminiformans]
MRGLRIYLADGTYNGTVTMSSDSSKISAIRVTRENISNYENELGGPGVYLLLVGSNAIYVGQTGLDTIQKRIQNTHSGDIDSLWHTVLGFKFTDFTISSNELLFIENAMCEYVYAHGNRCLTTSPKKENCTRAFRKKHYHLSGVQIHTCENYIEDIKAYIAMFPAGIFPSLPELEEILHISGKKVEATAYISGNQFVVCKGSEFSITEMPSCSVHIRKHRKELMDEGKVQAGRFTEDVPFSSPSAAAACVIGGSANGLKMWLYPDGKSIKEREESTGIKQRY